MEGRTRTTKTLPSSKSQSTAVLHRSAAVRSCTVTTPPLLLSKWPGAGIAIAAAIDGGDDDDGDRVIYGARTADDH